MARMTDSEFRARIAEARAAHQRRLERPSSFGNVPFVPDNRGIVTDEDWYDSQTDCGYELTDPKHPTYHERMSDHADSR